MTKGIFITGTGTDVGKTVVSASLMHLLRSSNINACYFKAVLSGAEMQDEKLIPGDTDFVSKISNLCESYDDITPYIYKTPVSPHLAAKIENKKINIDHVKNKFNNIKKKYDYIVMEGSGGILCPLIDNGNNFYLLEDLIKDLNLSVIVTATSGLGTINHTILTVKYIQSIGIKINGIIINGYKDDVMNNDNIKTIKRLTNIPILGIIPLMENLEDIKDHSNKYFTLEEILSCMDEI